MNASALPGGTLQPIPAGSRAGEDQFSLLQKICQLLYNLANVPGGGLPDQTGNAGRFLTTDGTTASWVVGGVTGNAWSSGAAAPAGGNDGDGYLRTTTNALYLKVAGVWTIMGYVAEDVTDLVAVFTTPTVGDKSAGLG